MNTPPKKVLIVDDCEDTLAVMSVLFEKAGAIVTPCSKALHAIDMVQAQSTHHRYFDLVVVDIRMPETDGNELASKLRSVGHAAPIIAFTASATMRGKHKSTDSGIDAYFSKATLNHELAQALLGNINDLRRPTKPA